MWRCSDRDQLTLDLVAARERVARQLTRRYVRAMWGFIAALFPLTAQSPSNFK